MDASAAVMAIGSVVLLFAALFMVGHYRRENRRARALRQMADWHWRAHRH